MRIGVMVPMSLSDGPGRMPSWEDIRAFAEHAEAVGLDSLWVCDHVLSGPKDGVVEGIHEAWTILSALAASTSRVELEDSPRRRVVPVDQLTPVGRVLGALALDGVVEASEGGVASHHLDVACPGGCALNVLPHVDTLLRLGVHAEDARDLSAEARCCVANTRAGDELIENRSR